MNSSQPKIVYNEECVDLRNRFEKETFRPTIRNLRQDPHQREWNAKPRTKLERNEVVNTALKKLARSYNTTSIPSEKQVNPRIKENTFCEIRKRFSESPDANTLKSKSEVAPLKMNCPSKIVSPSSPVIKSCYEQGDFDTKKTEPFKNKCTMTKNKPGNKEDQPKEGKNLKRDKSIEKLITGLTTQGEINVNTCLDNDPVWKDQRLTEKYSLLKLPWKRSYTLPVFPKASILVKEEYRKRLADNSDKKTYLFDDGSEVDSTYAKQKKTLTFGDIFQNQVLVLLNISAYLCALLVVCLVVWFLSGNKFFYKLLIPKPPEHPVKQYFKYIGGSIIYALTSVIRLIGSLFAIPTQQIYHPATEYSWPPVNNN